MRAKQEQPMISNEAKKTRDQPNLTECQSCGLRISSHKRIEILYNCWVPNSVASKRGEVCRDSKRNSGRVLGRSLEDANCMVQEKVEAAVRARELAVRKALTERKAAGVARKALDMVANNGVVKENNVVDDYELAFRDLCLVNSSCLAVARRGEGNGKTLIRNFDLRNPSVCGKLDDFLSESVDVECRKSNGTGDGKIRPNAKKDGSVGMWLKMGEQSFFSKLIDSRGNDHSVDSGSQSLREQNESMIPDDKSCKRKNDRYLLKYSRRKLDERSIPDGRPKFLYEGFHSGLASQRWNSC
ncbi:hypothetical protein IMY05_012G0006700 [Salix suchowensis]|nr:hypothetical protein IMY05_012G0006700 [Salix suchowensis]